ncbi:hypothetical protein [Niallia sp. MER 6]|nr:hypothetical protein [Niallia sp. MER 6]MCM3030346.1 hypothetical protein [Niallia sp. MER 6]
MSNFQKAEMMLQFAGEMLIKNRPLVANWATRKSHQYYQLEMKGVSN